MAEVPPRVILDLVDKIIEAKKAEEASSLIKAYLWRGPNISELLGLRELTRPPPTALQTIHGRYAAG